MLLWRVFLIKNNHIEIKTKNDHILHFSVKDVFLRCLTKIYVSEFIIHKTYICFFASFFLVTFADLVWNMWKVPDPAEIFTTAGNTKLMTNLQERQILSPNIWVRKFYDLDPSMSALYWTIYWTNIPFRVSCLYVLNTNA